MGSFKIIYEDESIIVVDKPTGMLVIPTPKNEASTLTSLLNRQLDERGVQVNAYPCHRLDRETSGLIIYAKGKAIQKIMMAKFKERKVKKYYLAFVQGRLNKRAGTIAIPIEHKRTVTKYRALEERDDFSVVEVEPITGRTNQIRLHFKAIGHPLVGERRFAFAKDYKLKFRRAALHASKIEFAHPLTNKSLSFTSPLPQDMARLLRTNIRMGEDEYSRGGLIYFRTLMRRDNKRIY